MELGEEGATVVKPTWKWIVVLLLVGCVVLFELLVLLPVEIVLLTICAAAAVTWRRIRKVGRGVRRG